MDPTKENQTTEQQQDAGQQQPKEKSQAELYYEEHMPQMEKAFRFQKEKKQKPATSNIDLQVFDEKDFPSGDPKVRQDRSIPHVEVTYNLTAQEVDQGLRVFQRKFLFRRNLVYSIILAALFVFCIVNMALHPSSRGGLSYFSCIVCAAVIYIIWATPRHHRKKLSQAMSQIEEPFTMNIYPEYIFIQEQTGGCRLRYRDQHIFVEDCESQYIIGVGKERIYIVPKRCLSAGQISQINEYFQALGDRLTVQAEQPTSATGGTNE